jgi:hypothetical protein
MTSGEKTKYETNSQHPAFISMIGLGPIHNPERIICPEFGLVYFESHTHQKGLAYEGSTDNCPYLIARGNFYAAYTLRSVISCQ